MFVKLYLLAMYKNEVPRKILIYERNEDENGTLQIARACISWYLSAVR
jgi:hypothetical protein